MQRVRQAESVGHCQPGKPGLACLGVLEQDVHRGAPVVQGRPLQGKIRARWGVRNFPELGVPLRAFGSSRKAAADRPFPWFVGRLRAEMKRVNCLQMAIFLLVALWSYARPSELLTARVFSLVRPANHITKTWSLLLSLKEERSSKMGDYDVSILLDSPWLLGWAHEFFDWRSNSAASGGLTRTWFVTKRARGWPATGKDFLRLSRPMPFCASKTERSPRFTAIAVPGQVHDGSLLGEGWSFKGRGETRLPGKVSGHQAWNRA